MQGWSVTDEELAAWFAHVELRAFVEWVELQPRSGELLAALKTVDGALGDGFQLAHTNLQEACEASRLLSSVALENEFTELGEIFGEIYCDFCSVLEQL